ncbi:hypothetical protein [Ralstonia holmesii]|uniref:hypothetical protein n=1 Tax=Ralstonia holmesii TaxID=3058602 RepID=UPI003F157683
MNDMTEFQQRAAAAAVTKMLTGKHFSICDLDSIAETMGRKSALAGQDYAALRAVHCMHWADMGPDLSRMVREKSLELLGLPPRVIEADPEAPKHEEPPAAPEKKVRLAFWKQN